MVASEGTPRRGFTPKFLESVRARDKAFELADPAAPGLRLRVHPTGAKVFRWYVISLSRVVTLGPWSLSETPAHVTLAQARAWLVTLKAARAAGLDQLTAVEAQLKAHLAPRKQVATGADGGDTVAKVAENFLTLLEGQRKRPEVARYIVEKDILPVIGALPLRSLKKSDCRAVVERVTKRGATVHAGKVLGLLKQLLDYAANISDDFVNPSARLKAANLGVENNFRDRWLNEKEIPLFWSALDPDPPGVRERSVPGAKTAAALRLLLLTAVRSAELRLAQWPEVDLEAGLWDIPTKHQKLTPKQARQAKPFVVPLTPMAVALFKELRELAGESSWVLASDPPRTGHYTDKALGRAMRRLWRSHPELKKLPEASPHDLRRSARTWLGKLGVPPHVAERALNHRLGRIVATYDQGDYILERRAALEKLGALVERLLAPAGSNVTFLPAAGA